MNLEQKTIKDTQEIMRGANKEAETIEGQVESGTTVLEGTCVTTPCETCPQCYGTD